MTRAISSPMTETVIDDADSVSADGGTVSAYARLRFEAREVRPAGSESRCRGSAPRMAQAWSCPSKDCSRAEVARCAIMPSVTRVSSDVRYWGQSGHDADVTRCLLLTQSGHKQTCTSRNQLKIEQVLPVAHQVFAFEVRRRSDRSLDDLMKGAAVLHDILVSSDKALEWRINIVEINVCDESVDTSIDTGWCLTM
jgi:hypothetical protein